MVCIVEAMKLMNEIKSEVRGKIVEVGTTEQIMTRPAHKYTRSLLAATPELKSESRSQK